MLGFGTTVIVLIIDYREVVLGHEMLSSIIHTIYKCVLLLGLLLIAKSLQLVLGIMLLNHQLGKSS
jgi:hypothetical protein